MTGIVLFGIDSLICADIVESCRRNDVPILAAIRNLPGDAPAPAGLRPIPVADITPDLLGRPFLLPMFGPENRRSALAAARSIGFAMPATLVDRTAIVSTSSRVEAGAYVSAGCIVASASVVGSFAFCNRGANIGHDCRVGSFVSIGPGAIVAGSVTIGEGSQIGAGAVILPKITIGAGAVVAPGAVVGRDVPDGGFAAGNPARVLARRPAEG